MNNIFELIAVSFENIIYNVPIKVHEFFKYGFNPVWQRLQLNLFKTYFLNSPYRIIKQYGASDDNFVYGETPINTLDELLNDIGATEDDVFIDLGCGRGLTVFGAFILKNMCSIGIDIIPQFIENGAKIADNLKIDKVRFTKSNFLEYDLSIGTIFFIAGTTFDDSVIHTLFDKLSNISHPIKVISLSNKIPYSDFKLITKKEYKFSWGKTTVYLQEKLH